MLKAIIFDIDGVLIDSFESNHRFFQEVFHKAGYKPLSKREYKKAFHLSMKDLIDTYIAKGDKRELNRVLKVNYKLIHEREYPKIMTGSLPVIKKLAKKYKLAIVTGRIKEGVDEYLDPTGLHDYFKVIVHYGHYKRPKPHPEPILLALKKLRVKSEEAIYIGDSLTDIQAAKAAGIKVILYNTKRLPGADYKTSSFKEILTIIAKI